MNALDKVIAPFEKAGCDPRRNGSGFKVHCPAHEDDHPSLSITEGDDGRVHINCHASCDVKDVPAAVRLTMTDLFPPKVNGHDPLSEGKAQSPKPGFPALSGAIRWMARKLPGTATAGWDYGDSFHVHRFELKTGGKEIKPFRRDPDGWRIKDPAGKLPLYHLNELAAAQTIFVVEGEKCVELVRGTGLVATTSAHGSSFKNTGSGGPVRSARQPERQCRPRRGS
jgi:hypothetical protein